MRHAVILAGGSGTRLWPASRHARPKQFMAMGTPPRSLLATTVERARGVADRVVVVTADELLAATRDEVPGVDVIGEPVARNTAPAIGLAAALIAARDPDATLVVMPADQRVTNADALAAVLTLGLDEAARTNAIGTVGITPTRADTGFGYLEVAAAPLNTVVPVVRFIEKPAQPDAERYAASGRHLWNGGIFFAPAARLLAELDAHEPAIGRGVRAIAAGAAAADVYRDLPKISIDKAVMERAAGTFTIPASVGWDDIGSWAALADVLGGSIGNAVVVDSNSVVWNDDPAALVAVVGVDDLVVVRSGDATLVVRRDQTQRVREIVEALHGDLARFR